MKRSNNVKINNRFHRTDPVSILATGGIPGREREGRGMGGRGAIYSVCEFMQRSLWRGVHVEYDFPSVCCNATIRSKLFLAWCFSMCSGIRLL